MLFLVISEALSSSLGQHTSEPSRLPHKAWLDGLHINSLVIAVVAKRLRPTRATFARSSLLKGTSRCPLWLLTQLCPLGNHPQRGSVVMVKLPTHGVDAGTIAAHTGRTNGP